MKHKVIGGKMQTRKWLVLAVFTLLLIPGVALAESLSMDKLKEYLGKQKEGMHPLDAYVMNRDDETITLRPMQQNKPFIIHFWATWCGPCVPEMPKLDAFKKDIEEGDDYVHVVAVSQDFGGIEAVKKFYDKHGITQLEPYVDVMNGLANSLDVQALPATALLNDKGAVIDVFKGTMEWDYPEFRKELRELIEARAGLFGEGLDLSVQQDEQNK